MSLTLRYERPAERWVEALPIGNGRLGAMVFGGSPVERLQLNEDSFWSGPPKDWNVARAREALPLLRAALASENYAEADLLAKQLQGPYTQSYLPLADLHLSFDAEASHRTEYRRELDLSTAVATTRWVERGSAFEREAFASAPDQVIIVHLHVSVPGQLAFAARLSSPIEHHVAFEDGEGLLLAGRGPVHVEPSYHSAPQPIVYQEGQGLPFACCLRILSDGRTLQEGAGGLRVEGATTATLIISARTGFAGYHSAALSSDEVTSRARADALTAAKRPYASLRGDHIADHHRLFDRVEIDLGTTAAAAYQPSSVSIAFRRLPRPIPSCFHCCSNRALPADRPARGRANRSPPICKASGMIRCARPGARNWTININTQMNYWPAELANLPECHLAAVRQLHRRAHRSGNKTARDKLRLSAAGSRTTTPNLWRHSAPVGALRPRRPGVGQLADGRRVARASTCGNTYAFGGDLEFLRSRKPTRRCAVPLEFCHDWLITDGAEGTLVTAPGTSPENKFTTPDGAARRR